MEGMVSLLVLGTSRVALWIGIVKGGFWVACFLFMVFVCLIRVSLSVLFVLDLSYEGSSAVCLVFTHVVGGVIICSLSGLITHLCGR